LGIHILLSISGEAFGQLILMEPGREEIKDTIKNQWFQLALDKALDTINEPIKFSRATVFGILDFSQKHFKQKVEFRKCTFEDQINADISIFDDQVVFDSCRLTNVRITFSGFNQNVEFANCRFKQFLYLMNLHFKNKGSFDFTGSILPDTIYFGYNSNLLQTVNFASTNFIDSSRFDYENGKPKKILIFLTGTDISKLRLDYIHFKLFFQDSPILTVKTQQDYDEEEGVYEALLANFKANGQNESFKLLDVEYQEFKWSGSWASNLVWLPKLWWNWGYDKEYIFIWVIVCNLFFTILTYLFINYLNTKVYLMKNIPHDPRWRKVFSLDDFGNRLWYSFVYTSTTFFRLTLKVDEINFQRRCGAVYLMIVYTLGLVCLAYMANFVLQR